MSDETPIGEVHARINALQHEMAYILARMAAGEDPNSTLVGPRDVAARMADFMRTFIQSDNWARTQQPELNQDGKADR
jgi:hypothetical protein